jgi:cell division protein ZipA
MESFLRLGLLFIAAFVIFLIFYDVWFRRVKRPQDSEEFLFKDSVSEPFIASKEQPDSFEQSTLSPFGAIQALNDENALFDEIKDYDNNPDSIVDDIIIISVFAKSNGHFASYDLLQAITATGMQFGERDIFHYYQSTETGHITLFSLASATKPGKFDLDRMGDFSCIGLSLFMDKQTVPDPKAAFLMMLDKAEQLAEDLDGELRAGPLRKPWSEQVLHHYLSAVAM